MSDQQTQQDPDELVLTDNDQPVTPPPTPTVAKKQPHRTYGFQQDGWHHKPSTQSDGTPSSARELDVPLAFPSKTYPDFIDPIGQTDAVAITDDPDFRNIVASSLEGTYRQQDTLQSTLDDPTADFTETIEAGNKRLNMRVLSTPRSSGAKLSGVQASVAFSAHAGQGVPVAVPLWNSGMCLQLKPLTESDYLSAMDAVNRIKVDIGRNFSGHAFDGASAELMRIVTDLIGSHITSDGILNDATNTDRDVFDLIRITDAPALIVAALRTYHRDGFRYIQPCGNLTEKGVCKHVNDGVIDLSRVTFVNKALLSEDNIKHMSACMVAANARVVSIPRVKEYQASMLRAQPRTVVIKGAGDDVVLELTMPSIRDVINAGRKWMNGIIATAERTILEGDTEARNTEAAKLAKATSLVKYSSYISKLSFGGNYVDDPESIIGCLVTMTQMTDIRKQLDDAIGRFISDATVAVVGIRPFDCPECGQSSGIDNAGNDITTKNVNVVPFDPLHYFFIVAVLTERTVTMRDM